MAAKGSNRYKIDIVNLKNEVHEYDFDLDKSFFESFENSPVTEALLKSNVTLEKNERHIIAVFRLCGSVELICDRSLRKYDETIDASHQIIFKFGDRDEEIDEEVVMISRSTDQLDLRQYLYEFTILSLPVKKLHPELRDEDDEDMEVFETMVYTSDDSSSEKKEQTIDPRWEKLKSIKTKSDK